jgi:peptide/nickel transport system substrate-binding protein
MSVLARVAVTAAIATAGAGATATSNTSVGTTSPSQPARGGHLIVAGESEVGNPWTPAAMRCDSYCFVRARTFFDSVAAIGSDRQVHGMLAESIVPNDDYTAWTITVRDGIAFTDGTPVDTDAVVRNLQTTAHGVVVGAALKDVAKVPDPTEPGRTQLKIDKLDDMTFVIYTGSDGDPERPLPWRTFPYQLAGQWGLIASPTWLDAVEDDPALAAMPVGSGPFVVEQFEPRGSLEVRRNTEYWLTDRAGERFPYLDAITFRVIEDPETSAEALRAGDIDLLATSNGTAIRRIEEAGDEFSVTLQESFVDTVYGLIDLDKPGALEDRRVRCAMSLAIDREVFSDVTTSGLDEIANGLFSPGQQGHLGDTGLPLAQDLETARALIDDYESNSGVDVAFTLGHTAPDAVARGAELLLGWWSEIGIDVGTRTIPQNDLIGLALTGAPDFEVFLWRGHAGVVVDQQYVWWHSDNARPDGEPSVNLGRIRDPAIDAALDASRSAPTDEEAVAAAEEVNRVLASECYVIPIVWTPWAVLSRSGVRGLGEVVFPDGTPTLEPAGVNGQYWTHSLYLADS